MISEIAFTPPTPSIDDERGVPVEVEIWNTPVKADNRNRSIGIYLQDSWRLGRVTLNPALRYDSYKLGWPDESYTPNQAAFFRARHGARADVGELE